MAIKIVKDFLDKNILNDIQSTLFGNTFPYHFYDNTTNKYDDKNFFFGHVILFEGKVKSPYFFDIAMPILGKLDFNYIHRIKINCFVRNTVHFVSEPHRDMSEPHKVALFSINTNNGYTLFKDGDRVPSIENQMLLFDGREKHSSVTQTDTKLRVNININYV